VENTNKYRILVGKLLVKQHFKTEIMEEYNYDECWRYKL
jgi:hypothetical protein